MSGEIIFLGTGPTEPVRMPGRREERTNSSIILRVDDITVLFDCTLNFTEQIDRERIAPESIEHVFISHGHLDAIGGLPQLMRKNKNFIIYASDATRRSILENFKSLKGIEFKIIEHGKPVKLNKIEITPFNVIHSEKFPTFGFRINTGGKIK